MIVDATYLFCCALNLGCVIWMIVLIVSEYRQRKRVVREFKPDPDRLTYDGAWMATEILGNNIKKAAEDIHISFTLEHLNAIDGIIALGVSKVKYDDREVEYMGADDLLKIRSLIAKSVQKDNGELS